MQEKEGIEEQGGGFGFWARWRYALLGVMALGGLALAFWETFESQTLFTDSDIVARVNGAPIMRADYDNLVRSVEEGNGITLTDDLKERILQRLVEEELLLQRAHTLGLYRSDRTLRGAAINSMLALALSGGPPLSPDEETLRAFYEENRPLFRQEERLYVKLLYLPPASLDTLEALRIALKKLSPDPAQAAREFMQLQSLYGDGVADNIPDTALPPSSLQNYIGNSLTEAALRMKPGQLDGPHSMPDGAKAFLFLIDRAPAHTPSFEEATSMVEARWRNQKDDDALRAYLDSLARDARISFHLLRLSPEEQASRGNQE